MTMTVTACSVCNIGTGQYLVAPPGQTIDAGTWIQGMSQNNGGIGTYNLIQVANATATVSGNMSTQQTCNGPNLDVWSWARPEPTGAPTNIIENDVMENFGGCSKSVQSGGTAYWSSVEGKLGPYIYNTFDPIGTFPPGWNQASASSYHTYGELITNNGSTRVSNCAYIDHMLVNCADLAQPTGGIGPAQPGQTDGTYAQRDYPIIWCGLDKNSPRSTPADIHCFIQSVRVWTCAGWNSGAGTCYGLVCDGTGCH
jgi:hypothetical protein